MTLVASLFGDDFTILLSDRRLMCNGQVIDDESNKATSIVTEDATLVCGFTGLARSGSFSTQDWLLDALAECAPPDYLSVPTLQRLTRRISTEFAQNPALKQLPFESKRLALLFAGFFFAPDGVYRVAAYITNYGGFAGPGDVPYDPKDFALKEIIMDSPSRVAIIGAWPAVTGDDICSLNEMLVAGKKSDAVLGKAIELFHSIAERPASRAVIGGQLSSIVLHNDRSRAIETGYHARKNSYISYTPNFAFLTRRDAILVKGGMIHDGDHPGNLPPTALPIAVPKVHRNAPCPCGSKKRYKECHGRPPSRQGNRS